MHVKRGAGASSTHVEVVFMKGRRSSFWLAGIVQLQRMFIVPRYLLQLHASRFPFRDERIDLKSSYSPRVQMVPC